MGEKCGFVGCEYEKFKNSDKCIFHCEKEDWYTTNTDGSKKWNDGLVSEFWKEIREKKIKNEDYYFSYYIFPEFEEYSGINNPFNFFTFEKVLDFSNSKFLGNANFSNIQFKKDVYFTSSIFYEWVDFNLSTFEKTAYLNSINFHNNVFFEKTKFKEVWNFCYSDFSLSKIVIFEECEFALNFENIERHQKHFQNVNFPDTTKIINCDLTNVSFLKSRITDVHFETCKFPKKIQDEIDLEKKISENKTVKAEDYENVENIYRQLKYNFDEKKSFQQADEFYVREMEMKHERFNLNKGYNWVNWIISWLYRDISVYNSSPMRALLWLSFLILFFALIYHCGTYGSIAFEYSFTNAIPFVPTPENMKLKDGLQWFGYFQKIISAGIILLFGLSLRRKFKR